MDPLHSPRLGTDVDHCLLLPKLGGCSPDLKLSLAPVTKIPPRAGSSRRGAHKGEAHFALCIPKHRKGLTEEIPALSRHVPGYSPGSKHKWKGWTHTYICAAAASPESLPT